MIVVVVVVKSWLAFALTSNVMERAVPVPGSRAGPAAILAALELPVRQPPLGEIRPLKKTFIFFVVVL